MTICVSIKLAEGLVMAADSAVVLEGEFTAPDGQRLKGIIQTFEFASKVSQVKDYPIGIMSWGGRQH